MEVASAWFEEFEPTVWSAQSFFVILHPKSQQYEYRSID